MSEGGGRPLLLVLLAYGNRHTASWCRTLIAGVRANLRSCDRKGRDTTTRNAFAHLPLVLGSQGLPAWRLWVHAAASCPACIPVHVPRL